MPGIFGIYPFGQGRTNWNISRFVYYGLSALQGRGQETAAITTYIEGGFLIDRAEGLVDRVYGEDKLARLSGFVGLGQVSPIKKDFPVYVNRPVRLVLIGDGKPMLHPDKKSSFQIFAKNLSKELYKTGDPIKAAMHLVKEVEGGYSFLALTEAQQMIAGRDRLGVKPLETGSFGFDLGGVASESCAFDVLGMEHSPDFVRPGEVVVFDPFSIKRERECKADRTAYCSFEYVYLARPDSVINRIPIYMVRDKIGERLAREDPVDGDVVIGVPETAEPFAMTYSNKSGIPIAKGFIRTGRHVRSAIRPTQLERLMGIQLKLNPIRHSVDNKDVILIDDSVVRGNTLRNIVFYLKRKGAKRVHVRIGSPHLIAPCPHGTEVPPRDELIGGALSEQEIAEIVGADSFKYLSVRGLCAAIGLPRTKLCLTCWTGCEL